MVDLEGVDKGNISLPPRLQSPDVLDPNFIDDEHSRVPIINMQKALYDVQISDKEKRIKRLEDRNSELLERYADTETMIKNLDIETGDEIAYINRQISVQTDKIEDNRRDMNFIEKMRAEEKEIHLKNVNSFNEKYEATRVTLTSAIKALNAQINTLEDYKETREKLREKLIIRDECMAENDERVAEKLDSVDRKFKIDREKLKNEMYDRLLALAASFQTETSYNTSIPVRRLIRENIFINNELTQMVNESLKKKEDYTIMQSLKNFRSNSIKIDTRDKISHLKTVKLQRFLIETLGEKHSNVKKRLENLDMPDLFAQEKYDKLVEIARLETETIETHRRKLQVLLHRESVKLSRAKFIHAQTELRAKKYQEIVYDLKYALASALKMTETAEDILEISESQLISHLLHLIVRENSQIQCLEVASVESVSRPTDVYAKGDLGFVPNHIVFEDPSVEKVLSEVQQPEATFIDMPQISQIYLPTILLEDHNEDFPAISTISAEEESKETTVTTSLKETKEESTDLPEEISLINSVEGEETLDTSQESLNVELDDEEQE